MNHARLIKSDVRDDLLRIGRALRRFMRYPNVQGVLDRCLDLCSPANAMGGIGLLPSPVPNTAHAGTRNKVSVVLHEFKQAIACYWELCRTDETRGLKNLLKTLTLYLEHGLEKFDLHGDDAMGYYLVKKGWRDYVRASYVRDLKRARERKVREASKIQGPEPPEVGVQDVLGDVPEPEARDGGQEPAGPADVRDE